MVAFVWAWCVCESVCVCVCVCVRVCVCLSVLEKCSCCSGNTEAKEKQCYFGVVKLEQPDVFELYVLWMGG